MPVDLDSMFTTLSRQADAIPLATAEQARQRGRQRSRNRAVGISSTAVVCLVAVGATTMLTRPGPAPTPAASPSPLSEFAPPLVFGEPVSETLMVVIAERVYAALQLSNKVLVAGTDPAKQETWQLELAGVPGEKLADFRAVPQGLLVTATSTTQRPRLDVVDPMKGRSRWTRWLDEFEQVIPLPQALVLWSPTTGRTEASDWTTGERRWALDPAADPVVRTLGMRTADDPAADAYAGGTFVQVTKSGQVQVRDAATGGLLRSTSIPAPSDARTDVYDRRGQPTRRIPQQLMVAVDGRLYTTEVPCCDTAAYRVRVTDLSKDHGASAVVFSAGVGHSFSALSVCGTDRLCVLDQDRVKGATVAAVDVVKRRQLWRVAVPNDATTITSRAGRTLVSGTTNVVLDRDGSSAFRTGLPQADWLTDDTLVALPAGSPGSVVRVQIPDRQVRQVGNVPAHAGTCGHTTDVLVCSTETGMQFYRLG
ncbi:MAG TPA: PQQ-binding-like beta-propeller repeat protein [Actinoplanes sp.]